MTRILAGFPLDAQEPEGRVRRGKVMKTQRTLKGASTDRGCFVALPPRCSVLPWTHLLRVCA